MREILHDLFVLIAAGGVMAFIVAFLVMAVIVVVLELWIGLPGFDRWTGEHSSSGYRLRARREVWRAKVGTLRK